MAHVVRRSVVWVLAVALLVGPIPAGLALPSAGNTRISGRVFDKNLVTPAVDLTVQVFPEGAKTPVAAGVTDRKGRFDLRGLPADSYVLLLLNAQGAPLAAARIETRTEEQRAVTLALPDLRAGESATAPAASEKSGILAWMSTPLGATVTIVVAAAILAAGAHQITKDKKDSVGQFPVSPTVLP